VSGFDVSFVLGINGIPKGVEVECVLDLFKVEFPLRAISIRGSNVETLITIPVDILVAPIFFNVLCIVNVEASVVVSGFENAVFAFSAVVSCCSYFVYFFSSPSSILKSWLFFLRRSRAVLSEARRMITQYKVSRATLHWAKVSPWT